LVFAVRRFSSVKKAAGSMTTAGILLQRAFYARTGIPCALRLARTDFSQSNKTSFFTQLEDAGPRSSTKSFKKERALFVD
jgi:hypothetical protein